LFKNIIESVPSINSGFEKCVNVSSLVASSSFISPFNSNSFVYFALLGKPLRILSIITNDPVPFILNNLYIMFFKSSPISDGNPKFMRMLPITKNGNSDGNILFFHILKEKFTDSKTLLLSIKTSIPIIKTVNKMTRLINIFFIFSPFLIYL